MLQLLALRNKFRARPPPHIAQHERGFIEVNFFVCISLAKAIEYLNVHGLRSFYGYLHGRLIFLCFACVVGAGR